MKTNALLLAGIALIATITVSARVSFSALRPDIGGNYTMHKGDSGETTPGAELRLSLPVNEKQLSAPDLPMGFRSSTPAWVALNAKIFAGAGIALPARQVNGQYVDNVIPSHLAFNLGLCFPLGGSDY